MQLEELVLEWMQKAEQDVKAARFLLDMRPQPIEVIGFHAQQAAEKSLKAILVRAGITPPRTHDLVALHNMCAQQAQIDLDRIDVCARLTPYAVDHRYPAESTFSESEILTDLEDAEELYRLIHDRLFGTS